MSNNFGVECVAKNKKPQCDLHAILQGDQPPIALIQGVMYIDDFQQAGSAISTGVAVEIGQLNNPVFTLNDESPGVQLVPLVNAAPAGARRMSIPLTGNYHYDIDVYYDLTTNPVAGDTIQIGPTVGTLLDVAPTFLTANSHSLTKVYGTTADIRTRSIHVSGNFNVNAGQAVGIFRLATSGGATTFIAQAARLRIFRTGPRTA